MPDVSFTELAGRRVVLRRFRPQDLVKGEWTDDLLYALLHDEWQAFRT